MAPAAGACSSAAVAHDDNVTTVTAATARKILSILYSVKSVILQGTTIVLFLLML